MCIQYIIHTIEYPLAIKNEVLICITTLRDPETCWGRSQSYRMPDCDTESEVDGKEIVRSLELWRL